MAREVWRLVKSDSIGVSFGYMAKSQEGEDGTRLLTAVDLYEVSLTATPMHGDTRVVSWKSATGSAAQDRADAEVEGMIASWKKADADRDAERARMKQIEEDVAKVLEEDKKQAAREAKAARPIKVRTFEC